jgi:hypothetical protein
MDPSDFLLPADLSASQITGREIAKQAVAAFD